MNLVMFLLAGFETTTVTLGIISHILAKYPEEMKKLQDEIDGLNTVIFFLEFLVKDKIKQLYLYFVFQDTFEYDHLAKLEYMDMFIKGLIIFHS